MQDEEFDNFLWHMERYFKVLQLDNEQEKIQTASMCLINDTMLSRHRWSAEAKKSQCKLKTWKDFIHKLKAKFYPEHIK